MVRVVLLGAAVSLVAAGAATPDPIYQSLRQATITEAFVVDNIVLQRDAGTLTLKSGSIGFTAQALGRDTVAVFVGEGEFTLTPAMTMEKIYLTEKPHGEERLRPPRQRRGTCLDGAPSQHRKERRRVQPGRLQ